jgi:xanthine dehydrogenase YagS FAD-binding subunit
VKAFAYVNATSPQEALAALSTERGRSLPLAGGQDLLALMKDYIVSPERVVNVKALPATIAVPAGPSAEPVVLGAAARLADVAAHEALRKALPALARAAAEVGTPQIRNAGTVGGNLCQRPRCWYFRNEEFHCRKKSGAQCFAEDGENQFHAIFGNEGRCHIVHPSSLAVPLVAYGASLRIAGPRGERDVPIERFFVMPEQAIHAENVLQPDELVVEVRIPVARNAKSAMYEVRYKQAFDWPIACAAAVLTVDGDRVQSARIVMGAVAPVPWRSPAAERVLAGQRVTEDVAASAAQAAVADAKPMSENAYKVQVARTAVKRAILQAVVSA